MNEHVNQSEQASPAGADSPNEFAEYGYEETPVPYLPLPSESPQQPTEQTSPAPVADSQAAAILSSSSSGNMAATPPRQGRDISRIALLLTLLFVGLVFVILAIYHLILWGVLLLGLLALVLVTVMMTIYNMTFGGAVFFSLLFVGLVFVVLNINNIPSWSALLLIPICLGLSIATMLITTAYVERILKRKGVTIEGYITDHHTSTPRGTTYYHLIYSYEYNEMTYSLKQTVTKETYLTLHDGDRVEVRCLPEHPTIARLVAEH